MAYAATHLLASASPSSSADDRHRQPERGAAPPPAGPDRGEDRVGRDDEQADVDVVHADPRLDEEHPVEDDEQRDEPRHEPPPEEDPRQQVEQGRRQGAGDDPGKRHAKACDPTSIEADAPVDVKTRSCWRSSDG